MISTNNGTDPMALCIINHSSGNSNILNPNANGFEDRHVAPTDILDYIVVGGPL